MATIRLTEKEFKILTLVLERQPLGGADLVQLCEERLGIPDQESVQLTIGLLQRGVFSRVDAKFSVLLTSEQVQEITLAHTLDQPGTQAEAQRPGQAAADAGQPVPAPPPEPEPEKPPAVPPPAEPEHTAPETLPPEEEIAPPPERASAGGARWRGPLLIALAAVILLAAVLVPIFHYLSPSYPQVIKVAGDRELILKAPPADRAQRKAEDWIRDFARGRTSATGLSFKTLTVTSMETCVISQGWDRVAPYGAAAAESDPALGFTGTVVFATARVGQGEEGEEDTLYQFRFYLTGGDRAGYTLEAYEGCPASWFDPYYTEDFEVDGKTYTLSLCGEAAEHGHRLRCALLSDGESRRILYLTEEENTVYAAQHHLKDINGDGNPDLLIDTQYATQLCYLYDGEEGDYVLFPELCGGQVIASDALPGAVLFTDLTVESSPSYLFRWSSETDLSELARMETTAGAEGRQYEYYQGGELTRRRLEGSESRELAGDLNQNQMTLFGQYMAYAYWDELVVQTAGDNGLLALPADVTADGTWTPFTLQSDYPEHGLSIFVSPSGLLLVEKDGTYQVIPCAFPALTRAPGVFDLTGDGNLELLLPFSSMDMDPALLMARWNGGGWDLSGISLVNVEDEFKAHSAYSEIRGGIYVSCNSAYGFEEAVWSGGSVPSEDSALGLDLAALAISFEDGRAAAALEIPIQFENPDGTVTATDLVYTVELDFPLDGAPEISGIALS